MSLTCSLLCPSFELHSSTPAIIKMKVARAAPELFSWQYNAAEMLGLPIVLLWWIYTTCRTQSLSALWGCSHALWIWDHSEWDEKRCSQRDTCSASTISTCCGHPKHLDHLLILSFFPKQAFSFSLRQIFLSWFVLTTRSQGTFLGGPSPPSHPGRISSSYSTWRRFGKELDLASRKQKPSFALFNDIFNFRGRNPARQSTSEFLFTPMQDNATANIVSNLCYLAENYILRARE